MLASAAPKLMPRRVLHVVGRMDRGGIERWLVEVFRRSDRGRFAHEVVVREDGQHAFFPELAALNIPIHYCPGHPDPVAFARSFVGLLRRRPAFDVVHSHLDLFTGFIIFLARFAGVPVRIAHIHNDYSLTDRTSGWRHRAYVAIMRWLVARFATQGLAVSAAAANYFFGARWQQKRHRQILAPGVDLAPLRRRTQDNLRREELGIPAAAWVIGTTGRLVPQKNQALLIEAMTSVRKQIPQAVLVIAGAGPLAPSLQARAAELGLTSAIRLLGSREDVPQLLTGVFDAFVFPSLFEGLGLSIVEAQAAGLPCVISTAVPDLAVIAGSSSQRISPDASPVAWAAAIVAMHEKTVDHAAVWATCAAGPLAIDHGVAALALCHQ